MAHKMKIRELERLMKEETKFLRDERTQYAGYSKKQLAVVGGSKDTEFLLGLLYELYSGQLYGDRCRVRVFLVDSYRNLKKVEMVYASVWTSGLPLFNGLFLTSNPKKALPKAEYVIIHPFVSRKKGVNRDQIIKDKFHFFRKLSYYILDYCKKDVEVLLVGSRCMIPFRLILAICLVKLPQNQVHGLSRVVERAAAGIVANIMECNPNEIRGISVFGEDIADVQNAWAEWGEDCNQDLFDMDTIKYGNAEFAEMIEDSIACRAASEALRLPEGVEILGLHPHLSIQDDIDLPPMVVPRGDGVGYEWGLGRCASDHMEEYRSGKEEEEEEKVEDEVEEETTSAKISEQELEAVRSAVVPAMGIPKVKVDLPSESYEQRHEKWKTGRMEWEQWMNRKFDSKGKKVRWDPMYLTGQSAAIRFRECSQPWQCQVYPKPLIFPEDVGRNNDQSKRWVLTYINDDKFLKGTIMKKCRHAISGYSYAKGVITYIKKVLLWKKPVITNEVVCSPGIYGIPEGLYSSFPVYIDKKGPRILKGYHMMDITEKRIKQMVKEVIHDYEHVFGLFYNYPPREATRLWQMRAEQEQTKEQSEDNDEELLEDFASGEMEGNYEEMGEQVEEQMGVNDE